METLNNRSPEVKLPSFSGTHPAPSVSINPSRKLGLNLGLVVLEFGALFILWVKLKWAETRFWSCRKRAVQDFERMVHTFINQSKFLRPLIGNTKTHSENARECPPEITIWSDCESGRNFIPQGNLGVGTCARDHYVHLRAKYGKLVEAHLWDNVAWQIEPNRGGCSKKHQKKHLNKIK